MADITLKDAALKDLALPDWATPLSADEPCGPDLDLAGDPDFMNFTAEAESLLPAQYFSGPEGRPFDRTKVNLSGESARALELLARSRDLRLLVILAKLRILDRDLPGFVGAILSIAALLHDAWDTVHPAGEDGDFSLRGVVLQSLDDIAPVTMPLQHVPLMQHPRFGSVSYRASLIVSGRLVAREGEEQTDQPAIDRLGSEIELDKLVATRDLLRRLGDALDTIRAVSIDRSGFEQAVKLERLPALVTGMIAFVDRYVALRDPAQATADVAVAAPADDSAPAQPKAGSFSIDTPAAATAALGAAAAYFARAEPSNPALLLVRQAEQLVGKSFVEVLQVLVPNLVDQAAISVGRGDMFDLPLERFSELAGVAEPDTSDATPAFHAANRQDALGLLRDVEAFYGRNEPSSPVPYLLERARTYVTRDFLSVLKDVLPENTLRTAARQS